MGSVYLARHQWLARDVAIKLLAPNLNASWRHVERFGREAWAAGSIDHENVVQVFDFDRSDEGEYFIVLEFIPGTSVETELAQRGPMTPSRALPLLRQLASGLQRAHELGVLHRDIKPANLMLAPRDGGGELLKVVDFGIAKPVQQAVGLSMAGELFGTPHYMAPEQWLAGTVDARTDQYAFGVTMFEMLSGRTPFEGDGMGLVVKHMQEAPPDLRDFADVPPLLAELVATCLQKAPADRFRQLRDVASVLVAAERELRRSSAAETGSQVATTIVDEGRDIPVFAEALLGLLKEYAVSAIRAQTAEAENSVGSQLRVGLEEAVQRAEGAVREVTKHRERLAELDQHARVTEAGHRRRMLAAALVRARIELESEEPILPRATVERALLADVRVHERSRRQHVGAMAAALGRLRDETVLVRQRVDALLESHLPVDAAGRSGPTLGTQLDTMLEAVDELRVW